MKIFRVINGIPYELELTKSEQDQAANERQIEWDIKSIRFALQNEMDNDDPDTDDPNSAKEILALFNKSEEFQKRVACEYRDNLIDCISGEQELECIFDAFKYILQACAIK